MSYILDALKKSEQARKNLASPEEQPIGLPETSPAGKKRPLWPLLIAATGVAALVLLWWLFSKPEPQPASPPSASVSPAPSTPRPLPTVQPNPVPAPPASLAPAPVKPQTKPHMEPQTEPAAAPPSTPSPGSTPSAQLITPPAPVAKTPATEPEPAPAGRTAKTEAIPDINRLSLAVQQRIPAIKIEGHIYDEDPSARMAIVNGNVTREGQVLAHGLTLEAITAKGVEFDFQGTRFRMGVFQSWPPE